MGAVLLALLVLAACTSDDASPRDDERAEVPLWLTSTAEPYPFTTPIPPLEPTAIDGTYSRRVTARLAGGASVPCRRCAPYRIETGTTELVLDTGRYRIAHNGPGPDSSQFRSAGHFTLEGDRIILFNDPQCPRMTGQYVWDVSGEALTLEVVEDECPFSALRQHFLQLTPWLAQTS